MRKNVKEKVYTDKEKITGAAQFFQEEENPKSDNNNESAITIQPNSEPIIESSNNPNPNPNYEKVKYTDSRVQRAFYYDKHLIKIFDKEYPKSKYNKSEIMNELLRNFLIESGKI